MSDSQVNTPLVWKNIQQLRILVFACWIGFAIVLLGMPLLLLRDSRMADASTILRMLKLLAGLWLPATACFGGFWFGIAEKKSRKTLDSETVWATMSLTFLYFGICLLVVGLTVFGQDYGVNPQTNEPLGPSLDEQLANAVGWLQLISPVFLAPVGFLTGRVRSNQS